ncbi:melanoma-associated antigen B1-like [Tenrec ecaudatus]|uniref:melanoma-associated antigen B1-like n=1 Tax=Tenrec ecaudatus TaxID=94439 RepID=UPI003F590B6C
MPRGQKSKLRAREKRRRVRGYTRRSKGEGSALSSLAALGKSAQSSPGVSVFRGPLGAESSTTAATGDAAKGQEKGRPSSSGIPPPTESTKKALRSEKVDLLLLFLLNKYRKKEPVTKAEIMKVIGRRNKESYPGIMNFTSKMLELIFCLDLKEMEPLTQSYVLLRKLYFTEDEGTLDSDGDRGFPRYGLLMALLFLIYVKGGRATEDEMWEHLRRLAVYDGKKHIIFGDSRKFITKDLVREKYLKYMRVPNSDPPRFELLWGPRAHAVTSKMQALEFYANLTDTNPAAFLLQYEAAWRERNESQSPSCSQSQWCYEVQGLFQCRTQQLLQTLDKSEADHSQCA